jgi:hypothetical protein
MKIQNTSQIYSYSTNSNNKVNSQPTFGLRNPKAALLRAENLKSQYAKYGVEYLMPNEVLKNKKIYNIIDKFSKEWDKLGENKTADILNSSLSKVLPKNISEKIKIKDFSDLKNYLVQNCNYTESQAQDYVSKAGGMSLNDNGKTLIFLKFDRSKDIVGQKYDKDSCLHELKHALTARCTNIYKSDMYNKYNAYYSSGTNEAAQAYANEIKNYDRINLDFYYNYNLNVPAIKQEPTTNENMLKYVKNERTGQVGFASIEDLKKDVANEFQIIIDKYKNNSNVKLPENAYDNKIFWTVLKHGMQDEKEAYREDKVFRECFKDKKQPVNLELKSLMFNVFERFCKDKADKFKN